MSYKGRCSYCGFGIEIHDSDWHRELGCCISCGLNARLRGVILAVSLTAYGDITEPLIARGMLKLIRVLGISDSELYADGLASKFEYVNSFLHREPRLDICDTGACAARQGSYDIVICSDVIEHTLSGPAKVIRNLLSLLAPEGTLVLTAPSFQMEDSVEWYGGLSRYEAGQTHGRTVLRWWNLRGQEFVDREPILHGGQGATVELRLLSHSHLVSAATMLGAKAQTLEFEPGWGYSWPLVPQFPYLSAPADGRVVLCRKPAQ